MSKSLDPVDAKDKPTNKKSCYSAIKNKHKRVQKSKENILKLKCNRELKNKLKKYKLRRDGIEDPDILDVSKILVTSLRIKSPSCKDKIYCNNNTIESEEIKSENYLIRMVRRKKTCIEVDTIGNVENDKGQSKDTMLSILSDEAEDKKHMDAFKLMMDARNKSIGSNSPGKEKIEESEPKDIIERKENKAKRLLSLQKMADSKGSLENKEIEEFRDKTIEKKMIKRAKRFKDMIIKPGNTNQDQPITESSEKKLPKDMDVTNITGKKKLFTLCDIFEDTIEIIDHHKNTKMVPKEDIDFFKKLSPSIKKKENMLSYFRKLPKDEVAHYENNCILENDDSVIKVKFTKCKKKTKILQTSEDLHTIPKIIDSKAVIGSDSKKSQTYKRCKRKRNINNEDFSVPLETKNISKSPITENRPKRNAKKPVKYSDDIQIFSSDEELHIFTPKKKKNNDKSVKSKIVEKIQQESSTQEVNKGKIRQKTTDAVLSLTDTVEDKKNLTLNKKKTIKRGTKPSSKSLKPDIDKKEVKLAPIFVTKMHLSPADIEAKINFLKSGVPDKLKKKMMQTSNVTTFDIFPSVVHIQQHKPNLCLHQEVDWFNFPDCDEFSCTGHEHSFKSFLTLNDASNYKVPLVNHKPEKILKGIKLAYPKFPVYRTYHLLRSKSKGEFKDCSYPDLDDSIEIINGQCIDLNNENPDQLNWCDKYKPTSSKQIIGNFDSIKEIKKWLETWTENLLKSKKTANDDSDFSDFYHSDTDSRETFKNTNNVLILTGQTGSGKTGSVYAVASELAIKVIEVNASSKRTGKIMLQDLQEATQSHKVDRGKSGSDNSQKLLEETVTKNVKKRGRSKKVYAGKHTEVKPKQSLKSNEMCQPQILASQESVRSCMSLILIDDADIVFEQDDGFTSAISQLIQSSKRPVILITSSLTCAHLQKFLQYGKVLQMRPVLSRILGTWLDVLCLADMGKCYPGLGAKVLDLYKGDIRKTTNCLQFYLNSNKNITQGDEVVLSQVKNNIDDEVSSMSWVDSESLEMPVCNDIETQCYIEKQLQELRRSSSLNVFNIWWNLPSHYKEFNNIEGDISMQTKMDQSTTTINRIAHILDTISIVDSFDHNSPDANPNITNTPWFVPENASIFENENFEYYNKSSTVTKDICDELLKSTIRGSQTILKSEDGLDCQSPSMTIQRNREKLVARHNKLSNYLNPSTVLDHHATALDYWPLCRAICRIEKSKTDTNSRRNNRFCHYLKSLNILGKNDYFDGLADSLS